MQRALVAYQLELQKESVRWKGQLREEELDLNSLSESAWRTYFRFTKVEVYQLVAALQLPSPIQGRNKIIQDPIVGLCMLLNRLAYPNRLADQAMKFGWRVERVSEITNVLLDFIVQRWKHLLDFDSQRLTPQKLSQYAHAIHQKNECPLSTCWGFVDGTIRGIARPVRRQRTCYNGWKRKHCLKYHAIVTPDGLVAHLYGPVEGRRNDAHLWSESGIQQYLEQYSFTPTGEPLQVYGDPAYGVNRHLLSPYQGATLTAEQQEFNRKMSGVRIVVEWVFKDIGQQLFGFLSFTPNQRHLQQRVGPQFIVSTLLYNAHVCVHGSQITKFFETGGNGVAPPTLSEYFHN